MYWNSFSEFLAMGNHGLYVWGSVIGVVLTGLSICYSVAGRLAERGFDLAGSSVERVLVAGEPGGSIPSVRRRIEEAWGARCFDHWGMTEVGPLGFEEERGAVPFRRSMMPRIRNSASIPASSAKAASGTSTNARVRQVRRRGASGSAERSSWRTRSPRTPARGTRPEPRTAP